MIERDTEADRAIALLADIVGKLAVDASEIRLDTRLEFQRHLTRPSGEDENANLSSWIRRYAD